MPMTVPTPDRRRAAARHRGSAGPARRRAAAALGAAALAAGLAATGAAPAAADVVLSGGHVDAVAARLQGGRLVSTLKDTTRGTSRAVWRDPDDVTLRVGPRGAFTVPSGMSFLAPRGARAWLIPQVQRDGVPWAGWNTEEIAPSALRGGVRWTLLRASGPGEVAIFQTGSFGEASVRFSTRRRLPQSTTIAAGTHAHANWGFTARGTYRLTYRLSARTASGASVQDRSTLTFRVG